MHVHGSGGHGEGEHEHEGREHGEGEHGHEEGEHEHEGGGGDMEKGSMVNRRMRKGVREMEKGMGCYASCIQEALWPYL